MSQDSLKPSPQTPSSPNYVPISSASNSSQSSLMSISDISQNTLSQDTQASSPKYLKVNTFAPPSEAPPIILGECISIKSWFKRYSL